MVLALGYRHMGELRRAGLQGMYKGAQVNLYDELTREGLPKIEKKGARMVYGTCGDLGRGGDKSTDEPGGALRMAVLDYLAKRVGREISTGRVAEATGYNYTGVARVMSRLRRKEVIVRRRDAYGRLIHIITEEIHNERQGYRRDDAADRDSVEGAGDDAD